MGYIPIKIQNPVYCNLDTDLAEIFKWDRLLTYDAPKWETGDFGEKIRTERRLSCIYKFPGNPEKSYFYYGLLGRVQRAARSKGYRITTNDFPFREITPIDYDLEGITLREDQGGQVKLALIYKRGVIKAPTGSGKTILMLALASSFRQHRILILCHTKDLMKQLSEEFEDRGFDVGLVGGGNKETDRQVTIGLRQSVIKLRNQLPKMGYNVVMVDECHHLTAFSGQYAKILNRIYAPIRFGFTATLPESEQAQLVITGLLGPLIKEVTIQKGAEEKFLAKPVIKLLRPSTDHQVRRLRRYDEVYNQGVVNRLARNALIAEAARKSMDTGKIVLIIVTRVAHGQTLNLMIPGSKFVYGNTDADTRDQVRHALSRRKEKCVICTAVWREGVNIPSLNVVINAAGGKSEIMTLQAIGRGLRKTSDKDEVVIIDVVDDSHAYLAMHSIRRICLYMDNGWLGGDTNVG